jgi:uncharacterized protein VirK/YbjX
MIRSGAVHTAIGLASTAMPQYAPIIYGTYRAFQYGWTAVQVYREYKQLREEMSIARAKRVERERVALREGTELVVGEEFDTELEKRVSTWVAILLARPEVEGMLNLALRNRPNEQTKQRFTMMLQATTTQFLVGAVQGGRGQLIGNAAKMFFR